MPKQVAANIHAFIGTDDARVTEAAHERVRALTPPDAGDFGNEIISGAADNTEQAVKILSNTVEALQTLPFFGNRKVVWLKNANFLGDNATGNAAATLEAVENLGAVLKAGLGESVHFVINATGIDKRRSFYKNLSKLAGVTVLDRPDTSRSGWETEVMGLVTQSARKRGLKFEREALELFVMLAGEDTRQIGNELEKLDLFLGERREVSTGDVRSLVAHSRAGIVFEIGDAIGKRQLPLALERIDQLIFRGESAIGILLAAIVPKVRGLLIARDLIQQHPDLSTRDYRGFEAALRKLPEADTAQIPQKKDGSGFNCYPLFLAARECGRFQLSQLRAALTNCLEANFRLVTTQLEPKLVLDQLVIRLLT